MPRGTPGCEPLVPSRYYPRIRSKSNRLCSIEHIFQDGGDAEKEEKAKKEQTTEEAEAEEDDSVPASDGGLTRLRLFKQTASPLWHSAL